MRPQRPVTVVHTFQPEVVSLLRQVVTLLTAANAKETHMSAQLDALTASVNAETTVTASAVTLLNGLKQQLDAALAAQAAGDNGAALTALAGQLDTQQQALAAAVTANTPVAPVTPVTPVTPPDQNGSPASPVTPPVTPIAGS